MIAWSYIHVGMVSVPKYQYVYDRFDDTNQLSVSTHCMYGVNVRAYDFEYI